MDFNNDSDMSVKVFFDQECDVTTFSLLGPNYYVMLVFTQSNQKTHQENSINWG